jgi:hypothetical protein
VISFLFFFVDFLFFAIFHQWMVYSLLVYVVTKQIYDTKTESFFCLILNYPLSLFLLLLEDFFLHGKLGFILIWLVLTFFIVRYVQRTVIIHKMFSIFFAIATILAVDNLITTKLLFTGNINFFMTITKVFGNIGIGYLVFLGLRSNRSFS